MAVLKKPDPEDKFTEFMFKRAKELGYDVDNPKTGDAYKEQTKHIVAAQQKKKETAKK